MTDPVQSGRAREGLSPLKQAFLALEEADARIRELESRRSEPIAVVGIGCRIPGAESGPEGFWRLLRERRCSVEEKAAERFRSGSDGSDLPRGARWAALLDDVDWFDPRHFGISPREAAGMDPQQRLLLEVTWEALENAAIDPSSLYQTNTGVFIGVSSYDYAQLKARGNDLETIDPHFASGVAPSVAAGRISYVLGLNGPAISLDTACSSSLVAVHLACEALRHGDCTMALAGGVNLILSPEPSIAFAQAGMLSEHGECRAFDSRADGFVRGEGCGLVVLKRLADAERAGDRILGVILGSAVNQDGASSGLTVPNGLAQQALLREAHRRAGIEARQVGYVEAHGTGTSLGDPIEAEALGAVFGEGRHRENKLLIGSVKTNVGHLEAAAGVAGMIKVVLGLQHGEVPAQLHWENPGEHVRWSELPLEVVTAPREWPPIEGRRIGGVSSFGFSGTNAHVVVEGRTEAARIEDTEPREEVLVVTARTQEALRSLVERYAEFLSASDAGWSEICSTAAFGRAALGERLAVVAAGKAEAAQKLRRWLRDEIPEGLYTGRVSAAQRARNPAAGASAADVAAEFVRGAAMDWAGRWRGQKLRRVALPTYAFQRERFAIEPNTAAQAERGEETGRNLLGRRLRIAGVRGQYETQLSAASWIGEHVVAGRVVMPATGHLELMLEAGAEALARRCILEDVVLEAPLAIAGERRVQTIVEEESSGRSRVRVYAEQAGGAWERVSEAWLRTAQETEHKRERLDLEALRKRLQAREAGADFYAQMASRGLEFGQRFRGVERTWVGVNEALGEIAQTESDDAGWELSPWWLDACLQVAALAVSDGDDRTLYLPVSMERLEVDGRPGRHSCSYVTMRRIDGDTLSADVTITDTAGLPLVRLFNFRFRKLRNRAEDPASWMYRLTWQAEELANQPETSNKILVVGEGELAAKLTLHLRKRGAAVDSTSAGNLTRELSADFNAVVWVCGPSEPFDQVPPGMASSAIEGSARSLLTTAQHLLRQHAQAMPRLYVVTVRTCAIGAGEPGVELAGAPLAGLATGIAAEAPELRCTRLDCDVEDDDATAAQVTAEVQSDADSQWVAWRSGKRYVAKLERWPTAQAEPAPTRVRLQTGAGIEALAWVPDVQRALQPDEVEINTVASSVNFRDVLVALGAIASDVPIGTDCAGTVLRTGDSVTDLAPGDAVVAIAPGCFASHVVASRSLVVRKPEAMSFADAAAQSIAYLTADYCLNTVGRLRPGQRVLIHAAAGGVGLAAVHLCRQAGAEPIATAGSEKKRAFLRNLGVARVYDSRSLAFGTEISGGVDLVLNSLAGEAIDAALGLLNPGGQFVELGKTDLRDPESVERKWPGVRYVPVDLTPHFSAGSSWVGPRLAALLREVAEGSLPLLPATVFDSSMVKQAFRFMARAEHIGRVAVEGKAADGFSGAHLITGGLRGIGLQLAEWLAANGAGELVLVGRHAPDEAAVRLIERLKANGVLIQTVLGDIADPKTASRAIEFAGNGLRGVWHCAGVLDNASLEKQSWGRLQSVFAPKIDGAWNLHALTRELPIEFFVLFSSWASIGGSHGQVNHCAASAFLDGLAHFRRASGLPALSVDWGAWADSGAASDDEVRRRLARSGMERMPLDGALEALRFALRSGENQLAIASIHWARYQAQRQSRGDHSLYADVFAEPDWSRREGSRQRLAPMPAPVQTPPLASPALQAIYALPAATREAALLRTAADIVRRTLGLHSAENVDPDVPLSDLGMDSLLAIELRNDLSGVLHRPFPSTILFDYPTLRTLAQHLSRAILSTQDEKPVAVPAAQVRTAAHVNEKSLEILDTIERMSDEEVESWFE